MTSDKTNVKRKQEISAPILAAAGDWAALQRQAGSADSLCSISPEASLHAIREIRTPAELRQFLFMYQEQLLGPVELPAARKAFDHVCRGEARELVHLDKQLALETGLAPFAEASQFVGRRHLKTLKPLRGHSVVRKYIAAVESGEAHGWNTIVYGVLLGVYSFPLREGLVRYAEQTLGGFLNAASEKFLITSGAGEILLKEILEPVPALVERTLGSGRISILK